MYHYNAKGLLFRAIFPLLLVLFDSLGTKRIFKFPLSPLPLVDAVHALGRFWNSRTHERLGSFPRPLSPWNDRSSSAFLVLCARPLSSLSESMCLWILAAQAGRRDPKPHDLLRGRQGGRGGLGGFSPELSSTLVGRREKWSG